MKLALGCVGGTFNVFHRGHKVMLDTAMMLGKKIIVGITADEFAARLKKTQVRPWNERKADVVRYLRNKGASFEVVPLHDMFGPALREDCDFIVVSRETEQSAHEINKERERRGLRPLKIIVIGFVLADDAIPLSATRILRGEVDCNGRTKRPIVVAIGTTNPVKVRATRAVFEKVFKRVVCKPVSAVSKVGDQPFGEDTVRGAINRAKFAISAVEAADYGVGIEAGMFWCEEIKKYMDVQYCAIIDRTGRITIGHGPGFYYPRCVEKYVLRGHTVAEAMNYFYNMENIGKETGAVGFFSKGLLDRTELTKFAVITALIPRMSTEWYEA